MRLISKGGRPRKAAPKLEKYFVQHVNLNEIVALQTALQNRFPILPNCVARDIANCTYMNMPIDALRNSLRNGLGNKPKFHTAILLLDIARVLAKINCRSTLEELKTISGFNEERVAQGVQKPSELDQIARVVLRHLGRPNTGSLRQQARQAQLISIRKLP